MEVDSCNYSFMPATDGHDSWSQEGKTIKEAADQSCELRKGVSIFHYVL